MESGRVKERFPLGCVLLAVLEVIQMKQVIRQFKIYCEVWGYRDVKSALGILEIARWQVEKEE